MNKLASEVYGHITNFSGEGQIMLLSSIAHLLCSANEKVLPDIVDKNVRDHMKTIDFDKMQQGSPTVSKELLTI